MKKYNMFQAIYLSFFSKNVYIDVAYNWNGHGFLYFYILITLSFIPTFYSAFVYEKIVPFIQSYNIIALITMAATMVFIPFIFNLIYAVIVAVIGAIFLGVFSIDLKFSAVYVWLWLR